MKGSEEALVRGVLPWSVGPEAAVFRLSLSGTDVCEAYVDPTVIQMLTISANDHLSSTTRREVDSIMFHLNT